MEDIYIDLRVQNVWIQREFEKQDFASITELLEKIEELRDEVNHVKEEYEDYKKYVEDNYRHETVAEQLDISDKDFI